MRLIYLGLPIFKDNLFCGKVKEHIRRDNKGEMRSFHQPVIICLREIEDGFSLFLFKLQYRLTLIIYILAQ